MKTENEMLITRLYRKLTEAVGVGLTHVALLTAIMMMTAWFGHQASDLLLRRNSNIITNDPIVVAKSGKPSGGHLMDPNHKGGAVRMENLRGQWTLIAFTGYYCGSLENGGHSDCQNTISQRHEIFNTVTLPYLYKRLTPHNVKLWVVRLDNVDPSSKYRPSGNHDRYLLAAQLYDHPRYFGRHYYKTKQWITEEWVKRYKTAVAANLGGSGPVDTVSDYLPFYALLNQEGELMFMASAYESRLDLVNAVYTAIGKTGLVREVQHDFTMSEPITLGESSLRSKVLRDTPEIHSWPVRQTHRWMFRAASYRGDIYDPSFIGNYFDNELEYCVLCGDTVIAPALYLTFGIVPKQMNGSKIHNVIAKSQQ